MVQEKAVVSTNRTTYTTQKAIKVFVVQFSTVFFKQGNFQCLCYQHVSKDCNTSKANVHRQQNQQQTRLHMCTDFQLEYLLRQGKPFIVQYTLHVCLERVRVVISAGNCKSSERKTGQEWEQEFVQKKRGDDHS